MSKMDNLRAMREARYEAAQKLAKNGPAKTAAPSAAPAKAAPKKAAGKPTTVAKAADTDAAGETLCGHRNMSGRTCTREHGHAAKSHRYS
ncbi:hypothetical protein [Nocardioides sp.]|uniref:hypothetical protein n=1 Tax=Nocardioides sp. TaxID=35761 RepID=UPI002B274AC8|nr:hypothetical protein [Nocardioides sp.]